MSHRPARLRPITTLKSGELVKIALRGRVINRLNAYVGTVVAVDGVAMRIAASMSRFDLYWSRANGEVALPWATIERVDVQVEQ